MIDKKGFKKKVIGLIAYTDLSSDPRQLKQIRHLRSKYEIISVGAAPSKFEDKFIRFHKRKLYKRILDFTWLLLKKYEKYYWTKERIELVKELESHSFDIIIVHNQICLPIAEKIKGEAEIILDAHEYYPEEQTGTLYGFFTNDFVKYIMKRYSNVASTNITVSDKIAEKYFHNFGLPFNVILNVPNYTNISPKAIDPERIKLVHHGIASPMRKIEDLILMMDFLDERYELNLVLVEVPFYHAYMKKLKTMAIERKNVIFIQPFNYDSLVTKLNDFDIGVYLLPPMNANLEFALPNKFFEFIQARLAIAIGPSYEMKNIVEKHLLGVVSKSYMPCDLAKSILSINNEQLWKFKQASNDLAHRYSFENEFNKLVRLLDKVN
jgi:ethanolamine utilization protein EutP (predicted NTPase)